MSDDDGGFRLASYSAEPLVVVMPYLRDGLFLKSAHFNGTDVTTTPADSSHAGNLQIVISSRGGKVEGRVLVPSEVQASGIPVVFVPVNQRTYPELFKTVLTDAGGRFSLSGIAPGDYNVFAFDWLESYSYFDPEWLKPFESMGQLVHVVETSKLAIEVKLIR